MLKLVPDDLVVPFMSVHKIAFVISVVAVVISLYTISTQGLNFGIDFAGGIMIEIQTEEPVDIDKMRATLNNAGLEGSVSLQQFGSPLDLMIRVQEQSGGDEGQQKAIEKIRETLGSDVNYRRVEFVGPQVGEELIRKGAYAVIGSMVGILLYIIFRFQLQFSLAAITALAHDSILTIGLFSFTQMEFNLSTVAAVLMIAGYSINDTVVVFDRVRENLRKYTKKPLERLFDESISSMLSRTILTSGTTLVALIALWIFGGAVIRGFVDALIWGVLIGTYSSVFVATPLLKYYGLQRNEV